MTKIEMIQSRIMERMQDILSNEQLQHLENVLAIEFHGIEVQEECTQLVTSEIHWQKILRTFIASKRIENCSPGTDDCAYHLHKYLLSRDDTNPALFVSNKRPHTRLGKQAIQSMLRTLGQKTEIHAHPHKFRRTLLTDAGNRGIPLQEIQMYAGHQKPDTTMMYVTVSEENVRASFRRYIA